MRIIRSICRWLLFLIIIPCSFVVLLELGLRGLGCGHSTRLFTPERIGSQSFFRANGWFYQQFLGLPLSWITDPDEFDMLIAAQKGEREYRVFVLGESTALGDPDYAYSFWRVFEIMFRDQFPDIQLRIYCLAYPAMNSHVMRAAALACAPLNPDLFVVYMGNNEFIGPYSHSETDMSLNAIRRNIWMSDMRFLQAYRKIVGTNESARATMPSIEQIQDPGHVQHIYTCYEDNLRDIVRIAAEEGALTLLCTVPSNLRHWSPAWATPEPNTAQLNETLNSEYGEGVTHEEAGRLTEAIERYRAIAARTIHCGHLPFRLARCYYALGQYDDARDWFVRARDSDPQRVRADSTINNIIRAVAAEEGKGRVLLADAERYLSERSPNKVTGEEFFWDYVHTTFSGNYQIAAAVMESLLESLPQRLQPFGSDNAQLPSEEACAARLGLSATAAQELWLQMYAARASTHGANDLEKRNTMDYLRARATECSTKSATETLEQGYERALMLNRDDWILRYRELQLMLGAGAYGKSLDKCTDFVKCFPSNRCSHRLMGIALAGTGHVPQAKAEFEEALGVHPGDWRTLLALAQFEAAAGNWQRAISVCDDAHREAPWSSPEFPFVKAKALLANGCEKEAEQSLVGYITNCPEMESFCFTIPYARLFRELDTILLRTGQEHRQGVWRDLSARRPAVALTHFYAAKALREAGDSASAESENRQALSVMHENEEGALAASAERKAYLSFAEDRLANHDLVAAVARFRYLAPRPVLDLMEYPLDQQLARAQEDLAAAQPPIEITPEEAPSPIKPPSPVQ